MVLRRWTSTLIELITFIGLVILYRPAFAQLDPSSSILVKPSTSSSSDAPLDSGRYTIKSSTNDKLPKADRENNKLNDLKSRLIEKAEQYKNKQSAEAEQKATDAVDSKGKSPSSVLTSDRETPAEQDKGFVEFFRDSLLGGDPSEIMKYKDQLHPEDPRQNILNITVAPNFMYLDSNSNYWYRRYHSSGPGLGVDANVWMTPFLGIEASYLTSLVADVDNDPYSGRTALVDHQVSTGGFVFRKYTSYSKKSPWFTFGLKFSEYQMVVPKADANRIRLKSKGLALDVDFHIPTSNYSGFFMGAQMFPKAKVSEEATAIQVKSGTNPTSYGFQVHFGQEFSFDRNNQIFWEVSHRADKTVYEGTATANDPLSGVAPSGVTVTSGMSTISVGYTWGD